MRRWFRLKRLSANPFPPQEVAAPRTEVASAGIPLGHIGHRRQICFWEPIFEPDFEGELIPYDWETDRDAGPSRRFISGPLLKQMVVPGDTFKVEKLTFKDCDFQGHFRPDTLVMFDWCNFIGCDFAYSDWKDAHFRNCTFTDSSISLAAFERCEFRDCTWERIGFGSKTEFTRTFISNPAEMIAASVSNTNPKDRSWKHWFHQWYRLRGTRAHVLRTLMISHQSTGDEHTYYEIVRLHELQCSAARITNDCFDVLFSRFLGKFGAAVRLTFHAFDYLILGSLGWLNKWGSSASRPCFALAACFVGFGLIYQRLAFDQAIDRPFQKSFDITFLVGYGNQTAYSDQSLTIVQDVHMLASIVIYTVFFATVISKLSRAR